MNWRIFGCNIGQTMLFYHYSTQQSLHLLYFPTRWDQVPTEVLGVIINKPLLHGFERPVVNASQLHAPMGWYCVSLIGFDNSLPQKRVFIFFMPWATVGDYTKAGYRGYNTPRC